MKTPQHIGIIMDGNRRWAKSKGLPTLQGHKKGLENFKKIAEHAKKKNIKYLTVFAFSTENWNRSPKEVNYLMNLFLEAFSKENMEKLKNNNVKINIIGQKEKFFPILRKKMREVEEATKDNQKHILNIALSYGGRADILHAVKNIIKQENSVKKINEQTISDNLWTKGIPDPDIIIRTGKERRISNFLIWQGAYAEIYFSNKHWPEFSEKDLDAILVDYAKRERRFGQ